jgi:hypothetical protein
MTKKENIETRRIRILKRLANFLGFHLSQDKDKYKTYWWLEVPYISRVRNNSNEPWREYISASGVYPEPSNEFEFSSTKALLEAILKAESFCWQVGPFADKRILSPLKKNLNTLAEVELYLDVCAAKA